MGLFSRNKEPKESRAEQDRAHLAARDIKFKRAELQNLLETAGGDYYRRPPPALREAAEGVYHKLPKAEKQGPYGEWRGVAYLAKNRDGEYDVVGVYINDKPVSKLTKEAAKLVWDKLPDGRSVPVACAFRLIGKGQYIKPSLDLYVDKPKPTA